MIAWLIILTYGFMGLVSVFARSWYEPRIYAPRYIREEIGKYPSLYEPRGTRAQPTHSEIWPIVLLVYFFLWPVSGIGLMAEVVSVYSSRKQNEAIKAAVKDHLPIDAYTKLCASLKD